MIGTTFGPFGLSGVSTAREQFPKQVSGHFLQPPEQRFSSVRAVSRRGFPPLEGRFEAGFAPPKCSSL